MKKLLKIELNEDKTIILHYFDEKRLFDMTELLLLKPWNQLLDNNKYYQAKLMYNTIVWGTGESIDDIDIAPETLLIDSIIYK
jgi:hypothetical protein